MSTESILAFFAVPHIVAGAAALCLFWCGAVSRKGSPFHRRAGKYYLIAMLAVIATAVPLTAILFLREQYVVGVFMAYLLILVSLTCRNSWVAVRCNRNFQVYAGPTMIILAVAATLSGLVVAITGIMAGIMILVGFGLIGPLLGWQTWTLVRSGPLQSNWWLREHFGAMIANGVATHIAFLQIGLYRLLPGMDLGILQNLAWFGPLVVATLASFWLHNKYVRPMEVRKPSVHAGRKLEKVG